MQVSREAVLGKIQTAHGSPATLSAATDAILVESPAWSYVDARMLPRPVRKATLGPLAQVYAGSLVQLTFNAYIKGSGVAGTPPDLAHFLVACGMAETITPATSVAYSLASIGHQYITLEYYQDGKRKRMVDAIGNVSGQADAGAFGMLSFTFVGHEDTEIDAAFPSISTDATVPVPYINRPFSIGGYGADISKLAFDLGNDIKKPASVATADGYGQLRIGDRDIAGSFDPLDVLLATHDFVDQWKSGAAMALDTGVVGSTAGNRWQIAMPAVSYRSVGQAERESVRALEMAYGSHESAGDDQFTITFT